MGMGYQYTADERISQLLSFNASSPLLYAPQRFRKDRKEEEVVRTAPQKKKKKDGRGC